MNDVALINGDMVATEFGDISLTASDDDDAIQQANNSIMLIYGENQFHSELGNMAYLKRLKISESGFATVEEDSKEAILNGDDRVGEVSYINAIKNDDVYGGCIISYTLITTDGRQLDGRVDINIF